MGRANNRRSQGRSRDFKRTDRVNETIREIVATELERVGDERLEMLTVTSVVTSGDLAEATVYYSAMTLAEAEAADGNSDGDSDSSSDIVDALADVRWRIQKVINGAMSTRRVPQITFAPDDVLASALRIEELLAQDRDRQLPGGD